MPGTHRTRRGPGLSGEAPARSDRVHREDRVRTQSQVRLLVLASAGLIRTAKHTGCGPLMARPPRPGLGVTEVVRDSGPFPSQEPGEEEGPRMDRSHTRDRTISNQCVFPAQGAQTFVGWGSVPPDQGGPPPSTGRGWQGSLSCPPLQAGWGATLVLTLAWVSRTGPSSDVCGMVSYPDAGLA